MAHHFDVTLVADLLGQDGKTVFEDFGIDQLEAFDIPYHYLAEDLRPVTPDQIKNTDVIISMGQPYVPSSFTDTNRLTLIARTGVGYDMVDLDAATEADVMVTITPEATKKPVASATLALILGLCHRVRIKDAIVRNNTWSSRFNHMGCEIRDRVVGLIGVGQIGQEVVRLLKSFEPAEILAADPMLTSEEAARIGVRLVEKDTLLQDSDFISIHCPLNRYTHKLIGEREFKLMKPSAFIINTARGPIIDQMALTTALKERWIQGAAIDVFEEEPIDPSDPLLSLENIILSPHASAWTYELFRDIGHDCMKATLAVARGEIPPYVVNRSVLDRPGLIDKLSRYKDIWTDRTPA
jgi:phosphoglycerate dehydrogenase-like enzyme